MATTTKHYLSTMELLIFLTSVHLFVQRHLDTDYQLQLHVVCKVMVPAHCEIKWHIQQKYTQ